MRVIVVNQFNSDNIGDNLIGITFKKFLEDKGIDVMMAGYAQMEFQRISFDYAIGKASIVKRIIPSWIKYFLRYKWKIKNEIERISSEKIDAIIIGGGQLIKHGGVFPYCFKDWATFAKRRHISLYIYGVGVDDNIGLMDKIKYQAGLKYAKYISCRDELSSKTISKLIKRNVDTWPDVVFSYEVKRTETTENNMLLMPYNFETAHHHFKSITSRDSYYEMLIDIIKSNNYTKLLLSATTSADLYECRRFQEYLDSKKIQSNLIIVENAYDLIKVFRITKKVYTGRMHALILGWLSNCELGVIRISNKVREFEKTYLESEENRKNAIAKSKEGLDQLYFRLKSNG